jgi:hypothetical protein
MPGRPNLAVKASAQGQAPPPAAGGRVTRTERGPAMFTVICIWAAITLFLCLFSFFLGRLPVIDSSPHPWVMHRSYVPYPAEDNQAVGCPFRRAAG